MAEMVEEEVSAISNRESTALARAQRKEREAAKRVFRKDVEKPFLPQSGVHRALVGKEEPASEQALLKQSVERFTSKSP